MFEMGWVRFIVASLLLAAYGATEAFSKLAAWRSRPRVRRPVWSHLFGFVSLILFYGILGRDGRSWWDGAGNAVGVIACVLAMVLRVMASGGSDRLRHPDLFARLLFFVALPIAVGSPRSWIALTFPQAVIAAWEARQRDDALAQPPGGSSST